jgi:soluble lytic murein transglycosylase
MSDRLRLTPARLGAAPSRLLKLLLLLAPACACNAPQVGQQQDASTGEELFNGEASVVGLESADPDVRAAAAALRDGHAWRATRLVMPALRNAGRRTPEAVLVAARAAATWQGWTEVQRLLQGATWLDTEFAGDGRELLARAAIAQGDFVGASAHAAAAARAARDAQTRAVRLVLLGRTYDRRDFRDSARIAYTGAIGPLPAVADWLRIRAAQVTADGSARTDLLRDVRTAAARSQIGWADAQARERAGDLLGAARVCDSIGARAAAMRLRLQAASDEGARLAVRRDLVDYIRANSGTSKALEAVEVLDGAFSTLGPNEELVVARSASRSGPAARAVRGYERARSGATLTPTDYHDYGMALTRAGRWREAAAQLERVRPPAALAGRAAFQRARAMLRFDSRRARRELQTIPTRFAGDAFAASSALMLLADLETDANRDRAARALWLDVGRRYPTSEVAPEARFKAALIRYIQGDARGAAAEFDDALARYPRAQYALATRYWSGRAHARAGDNATARARWRELVEHESLSYYAMLSNRRLGAPPWSPPASADSTTRVAAVDSAMARIAALERLGLDAEIRHEYANLVEEADRSVPRLIATGTALRDHEQPSRAIALGWKAVGKGAKTADVYRLIYPVLYRDLLVAEARRHRLDPALVAALIRQESSFTPRAVSRAGARGLMQVMPAVGRSIARARGYPLWDPALLLEPDVSLELGTSHLADALRRYPDLTRALAAYNAGGSRVTRWNRKAGVSDPEIFAERIPFDETRDYVRIVQRNVELYRVLYGW